ncbi:hypothetical protein PRIPAC_84871 [Pristionchus pacificus]|uniref:Uncharacterized protein n=1 Tax=Pristionchus pacificus TaxID=54126 RepID=A0A2A6BLF1_PRIPA|nr:hypothetical protein PRIPAC_84871 [Pristionchus pacificus]|eukprot:PDM66643.1 hypothetical protein PRIPAC_48060 [Pristionchus pacificus]
MGPPRLASLALLLLALCRPVSSGVQWSSVNTAISTTSVTYVNEEDTKKAEGLQIKPGTGGNMEKLLSLVGNTVVMLGFVNAGIADKMPMHIQEAFINGLMCEFDQADLDKKLIQALYGQDSMPAEARKQEEDFFREKKGLTIKIDCTKTSGQDAEAEKCFCEEKKPLFYCMMVIIKTKAGKQKKICRPLALKALEIASPAFFKLYDLESSKNVGFSKAAHSGNVGDVSGNEDVAMGKLFCEARKDTVKAAIVNLYAADAMYWMSEAALMAILFGKTKRDLTTACAQKTYTDNKYGDCLCEQNTGFSFCIYKVLGDFFVEKGYLKCEETAVSFDKTKKPDSLPSLSPPSSNAATASGLLLLPVAAAAAMLLQGRWGRSPSHPLPKSPTKAPRKILFGCD